MSTVEIITPAPRPSWLRWPPNCCETCTGWSASRAEAFVGLCNQSSSLELGLKTDSRYRCPAFIRKDGI